MVGLHGNDALQRWLFPVTLVFPFVLWGAVGVAAGFVAVAFLLRYAKQT